MERLGACYNSKLGLYCNLVKNLKKNKRNNQLVKYKDTYLYLLLYIPSDYKEYVWCSWENNKR